jgi:hypothetical protein
MNKGKAGGGNERVDREFTLREYSTNHSIRVDLRFAPGASRTIEARWTQSIRVTYEIVTKPRFYGLIVIVSTRV